MDYIIFIISLAALIYGADLIINQSEKIALRFGISEYVVGATLIALGTSLPEMAASVTASLHHHAQLSVSNIIGSNIINIALVLGAVLLISKKVIPNRDFFAKDSSWALFPVLIFVLIALDGQITRFSGFALLFLMFGYVLFLLNNPGEATESSIEEEIKKEEFNPLKTTLLLIAGFIVVVYGADYTISSASNIAKSFGVSEWIIGVILIAFGTSLPELVVSIMAARANKADMAIGNVIGSNMANISVALGSAAIARPIELDFSKYAFDMATLVVATLMLVFITANKMYSKPAGISLLILLAIFAQHTMRALG